jgi:hypothetical protein
MGGSARARSPDTQIVEEAVVTVTASYRASHSTRPYMRGTEGTQAYRVRRETRGNGSSGDGR